MEGSERNDGLSTNRVNSSSKRIVEYMSEKIIQVFKSSSKEQKEYQHLAIISTGGTLRDSCQQRELEQEVGIQEEEGEDFSSQLSCRSQVEV